MSAHKKLKTASQLAVGVKLSAEEVDELLLDMVTREAETRKRVRDAQLEVERLADIVFTCDGIECVKHDVLVRNAVEERMRAAADAMRFAARVSELEKENAELRGSPCPYAVSGTKYCLAEQLRLARRKH